MIPEAVLNQIQDRLDIVEIVSGFVSLKRAGRNFKGCCPFHNEKTPSFMVSPDKQIFHCFGCGVGGNVFSFIMKIEKRDFREVVEMLAERVGVELPKDKNFDKEASGRLSTLAAANLHAQEFFHNTLLKLPAADKARAYLKKRGITDRTILEFKIGFAPDAWGSLESALRGLVSEKVLETLGLVLPKKDGSGFYDRFRNRIMFPITDAKGSVIAFGGRVMDDSVPKYMNSPESELYSKGRHLYGLYQARKAIRDRDAVLVVEGYMDLIACHQAGVEYVVASLGTALTSEQVRLIKRHTHNVTMLYDADKAGEMATLRGLELFLEEGLEVKVVRLEKGHDPDSFIKAYGHESFTAELSRAKTLFDYKLALLKEQWDARSIEGKVKIANEMVSLFAKVQNEILRSAWTKELARQLQLSEEALRAEMFKNNQKPRIAREEPAREIQIEANTAEKLLIGLWLDNPRYLASAKQEMAADDFGHAKTRGIVERLFESAEVHISAAKLVNFFKEDAESVRIISEAAAEAENLQDKQKALEDCLLWVRRSRIRIRQEALKTEINQAQTQGDRDRVTRLIADFNELNKHFKSIQHKHK